MKRNVVWIWIMAGIMLPVGSVALATDFQGSYEERIASSQELNSPIWAMMSPVANPADAANSGTPLPPTSPAPTSPAPAHIRSFEMPAIQVVGQEQAALRSEELIGSYEQPRWTATRRFTTTRVYVVPEGKVEVEYWNRMTFKRDNTNDFRNLYEIEVGLPNRFQLDLYLRTEQTDNGPTHVGNSLELRYALADWGKIWGNPAVYLEWTKVSEEPDNIEAKILLGGQIAPRWHWGANFSTEWQLAGELEHEWQLTGGLSYTVIDPKFSIGVESVLQWVDNRHDRGKYEEAYFIGPSFQFKPIPPMTVNLVPLIGFGPEAPDGRIFINLGYEF